MKIHTSSEPLKETAKALSDTLEKYKNTDVLLLLAGGSALQVLDEVDTSFINEYTTIMMMDERFTADAKNNNFLQMTKTFFYTKLTNTQCSFLPTVPEENESHDDFSNRIEKDLATYLETHPNCTVVALFGIGPDGHTGAIFPMTHEEFIDTYGQGNLYTKVVYPKNPFVNRSSITPKFIKRYITQSLVYAVGEAKLPVLSTITDPYELHEMPAHIHELIESSLYTDSRL